MNLFNLLLKNKNNKTYGDTISNGEKINQQQKKMLIIITFLMQFIPVLYCIPYKTVINISYLIYILNAIPTACLVTLFIMLHRNLFKGLRDTLVLYTIYGIANAIINNIRGSIILPADFDNLSTAMEVASNYTPKFTLGMGIGTVFVMVMFLISYRDCNKDITVNLRKRLCISLLSSTILFGWALGISANSQFFYNKLESQIHQYETDNAMNAGFLLYFFMNTDIKDAPVGYNPEGCQKILNKYNKEGSDSYSTADKPNVIVIMNEAFSDLEIDGIKTSKDCMPYIHSLKNSDNAITGYMHSSVLGGLTSCTEYEFLTGHSMKFYNGHIVPYNDIKQPIYSMVNIMENEGYKTLAAHPYYKNGYNRNNVYNYMGFDNITFLEDMIEEEGDSLSKDQYYRMDDIMYDQYFYEYIAKKIDSESQPVFSFNVTMQNHAPYLTEKEKKDGQLELNNYLSLIKKSDDAFKWLVNHYENSDKPTVIVMFGDHQPYFSEYQQYPNPENAYMVPFIMWSNCGIESEHNIEISANYGGLYLMEKLGISLPPYFSWLQKTRQNIPILTKNYYRTDEHGQNIINYDNSKNKTLKEYQNMQYYMLNDYKKNNLIY